MHAACTLVKMSVVLYAFIWFIILHVGETQKVIFNNIPKDITDNIFVRFLQGPTVNDYVSMKLEDGLTLPSLNGFDVTRETVFHLHSWRDNPGSGDDSGTVLGTAFLQRNTSNMVLFVYPNLIKDDGLTQHLDAITNASTIGTAIGVYFQNYTLMVQKLDLLHLISFGLGSQIMSRAARIYGAGVLPWLTAMDPEGGFYTLPAVNHLISTDGVFLDVIHTDDGGYGDYRSIGKVDFFLNKGVRVQPACNNTTNDNCSHLISYKYYAAAILNPFVFLARDCTRDALQPGCNPCNCDWRTTYIGYNVNKDFNIRMDFYLDTSAVYPYGTGTAGIVNYSPFH